MRVLAAAIIGLVILAACTPTGDSRPATDDRRPPTADNPTTTSGKPSAVAPTAVVGSPSPVESPIIAIPLAGPAAQANAEISGMAWSGDTLVLLPQYPERFGEEDGAVFTIPKAEILAFLDGSSTQPITPRLIPFFAPGLQQKIKGFEGFEAIAFDGARVCMTIEASPGTMIGYLVCGEVSPELAEIRLDTNTLAEIPPQAALENMSDETLLIAGERLATIYEANGANVNAAPVAHLFDFNLQAQGTISFPNIEYRITDATPPDASGRFWAINYFFTGDTKLKPAADPLAARFGEGVTHAQTLSVERLVEFQFTESGIALADTPPIALELLANGDERNWEALARLDQRGFLLATDKFPETILAFVVYP